MNKKIKLILITITLILSILLINQLKYRNEELYAVNLKNKIDNDLVSILVSDGSENYIKYEGDTFPSNTEYTYNSELSKCQDNNGNVIEGILSYDEESGKVNIRTKKTTYCYLYFDKSSSSFAEELIASNGLWQSGLEGDGYRYTGSGKATDSTSPNNFICFGTTSLTDCKANEDKYMYRIIGVFPDDAGEHHLKLIKYKQLGGYSWNSDYQTDISWEESNLYKGLNGISGGYYSNLFIGNTTYDYLQDTNWSNKIVDWKWTATNTLTYSNSGPNYYNSLTPSEIYLHEMNRSSKTNTVGIWTYQVAKIGLMYSSDYTLSLGSNALSLTGSTYTNRAILKNGWMHQSNNGSTTSSSEWTLSRFGTDGSYFYFSAWFVHSDGFVGYDYVNYTFGVRPVFYLTSNATMSTGSGRYSDPYIIQE